MSRRAIAALSIAGLLTTGMLATALTPEGSPTAVTAQAASSLPAPSDIVGSVVNGRAHLTWTAVPNSRDVVIFDVTNGTPGRVVGVSSGTSWTSARLPGTSPYSFQLVARNYAKQEGTRSETVTVYPGGTPTPTTPPPSEPPTEEPTDPKPEAPAAQPIRVWDVDPGDAPLDVWDEVHAKDPAYAVQVTTDNPFPGTDASIRYRVVQGDTGWSGTSGTLRAEVRDSIAASGNVTEGTEQFWGTANYLPADFDWDERNQFFGILQWHQTANSGNPNVHVWVDEQENMKIDVRGGTGGRTSGDAQFSRTYDLGPADRGAWDQLTFHFVWSSNDRTGLTEVWRDGVKVLSAPGANLYAGQSVYIKQGIYSATGRTPGRVYEIQGSNVLRGDSYESVQDLSISD